MTVVIPTLHAGEALVECLESLERQSRRDFEVTIVDNSGQNLAKHAAAGRAGVRVIANDCNVGFGAAVNQGIRASVTPFVATLNDDAVAWPRWIEALLDVIESRPDVGLCASRVLLTGRKSLDSAGMLLCADGSSKQRGHGRPASEYAESEEVLFPSGSAAVYRRAMLDETGMFDESFFLYVEDTDLGLRARWAGWKCWYVADAVVEHRYSHSAGRASPLKAYYVERNRLFLLVKCFPLTMLLGVPTAAIARYYWHAVLARRGIGVAAEFGNSRQRWLALPWLILRAHLAVFSHLPRLTRERRAIRKSARIASSEFRRLAARFSISPRQVAEL